jgi:uncharacterized protein YciI
VEAALTRRHVLFYDYVRDNVLERRAPHRDAHLGLVRDWMADGRILMAGALGDSPHGAALVFAVDDPAQVESFGQADPYVANRLVTAWRVEPWDVVS